MSDTPILAELMPTMGNISLLYTIPYSNTATGTIFCLNQSSDCDIVNIALVPTTELLLPQHYIAYGTIIYSGQSLYLQQIYLNTDDKIYVESQLGASNFSFVGTLNPTTI